MGAQFRLFFMLENGKIALTALRPVLNDVPGLMGLLFLSTSSAKVSAPIVALPALPVGVGVVVVVGTLPLQPLACAFLMRLYARLMGRSALRRAALLGSDQPCVCTPMISPALLTTIAPLS